MRNDTSREAFEAWWSDYSDLDGGKVSAWQSWQASRKALEAEQAQAVEPVAVFDTAMTEKMAVIDYDCTKHNLKSGDKLYTHPSPPPAGERADLIAGIKHELSKCDKQAQQGYRISRDTIERLSWTFTDLGYSKPKGGLDRFGVQLDSYLGSICRGVAGLLAQQRIDSQQVAVPDADMFWNHDDADNLYSSISEFLNDEMCNGTPLEVGDIRTVQRAVRLPNIDIRITSVNDDECDADYEIVEAQGAKT
jgi:hypothetical protein